ncbi:MAG: YfhO family protein [Clostridiales bacterium]|nr:YfhO family protein [Clostridiales bacterium]
MTDNHIDAKSETTLSGNASPKKAAVTACLISWALTALILLLAFVFLGLIPFGNDALLYKDGQQQMVDLFCWFKDVLSGKSSIGYTFTKYLGGSNFAVFSYYLSSPLNLLVVFFDKTQVPLFINVLYILKTSFASFFACFYLYRRFKPATRTKQAAAIILAVSYALGQYMIAQSSNMMWIDGVYMLPLIIAGVEKLVTEKKSSLFIISTALSLCFNWYTGIINLMFGGIWFLFESCRTSQKPAIKRFFGSFLRFCVASASALLISAVILFPTLTLLSGRTYGHSGIGMLLDFSMMGFVPSVITNYAFGFASVKGGVNLFAGSFVLLGVVMLFFSSVKLKEKIIYGVFLLTVILLFYWQPLVALFSMLRTVEGFWYRYAYVGIFAFVYLAAVFYLESDTSRLKVFIPLIVAAVYCVLVVLLSDPGTDSVADSVFTFNLSDLFKTPQDQHLVPMIAKMVFPLLVSVFLSLSFGLKRSKSEIFSISALILSAVVLLELLLNQMVLGKTYSTADGPDISRYNGNEIEVLKQIDDTSFHRIVQTSYHSLYNGLSASYSEPMAYGFNSVTAFVSAPDENEVYFLDRAGYPQYYDTIPVTVTENLALDSLLSVKYVLLPSGDTNNKGLKKTGGIDGFKDLYENPYAVPAAFVINGTGSYESSGSNFALYLNDLYRHLSGTGKDIFIPVDNVEATIDGEEYSYRINVNDENAVVYANFVTDGQTGATLYMNGDSFTSYAAEMAPKLLRLKTVDGSAEIKLKFNKAEGKVTEAQIYLLDLDALNEAASAMKSNAAPLMDIRDGHCRFEIENASASTSLFTSVPYHKGWTVTRNGKKIDVDLTGDALMTVPLEEGRNVIEMTYRVPNMTAGIAAMTAGILLLAGIIVIENRKNKVST